jgi:predicted metal-binding membrane protein
MKDKAERPAAAALRGSGPDRALWAVSAGLFFASVAGTIYECRSMSGGMPMPGGWSMSMAWMRMPGQRWLGAALAFVAMWSLMMVAMMLPSLVPALSQYRKSLGQRREPRKSDRLWLTLFVGVGYFFVWAVVGASIYPFGALLAAATMRWDALARSIPLASGVVLLFAGLLQLTGWKAELLRECRSPRCGQGPDHFLTAWRHGLRLGLRCAICCAGFMTALIVVGVMDLAAMGVITVAITAERILPGPERAARAAGILVLAVGTLAILRSLAA